MGTTEHRASRTQHKPQANAVFGDVLRTLRKQKGWSQEKLAAECSMDRAYISEIERGLKEPCLSTILKLAGNLGVDVGEMMNEVQRSIKSG